jgi:NADH-quinone oxidoreductase subunit A
MNGWNLSSDLAAYLPVLMVCVMAIVFAAINIVASLLLGPKAEGAVKGMSYESGMDPIGTTHKRFNVRFYILAMTFLLFDIEIIFLDPWALAFTKLEPGSAEAGLFLARIGFFVGTSVIAYVYAWKKGVFRFD